MEEGGRVIKCLRLEGRWKSSKSLNRFKKKKCIIGSSRMSWKQSILHCRALKAQKAPDIPGSRKKGNKLRRAHRKSAYEAVRY